MYGREKEIRGAEGKEGRRTNGFLNIFRQKNGVLSKYSPCVYPKLIKIFHVARKTPPRLRRNDLGQSSREHPTEFLSSSLAGARQGSRSGGMRVKSRW